MKHIMLDLETLGTSPNAAILDIAAVEFDPLAGILGLQFEGNVDLRLSPEMHHGEIDPATVLWWFAQSDAARRRILSGGSPLSIVLDKFTAWLAEVCENRTENRSGFFLDCKLWSNGPTFDEAILRAAFKRTGKNFPIHYQKSRCCRTILDLAKLRGYPEPPPRPLNQMHIAVQDAQYQAMGVIEMYRVLGIGVPKVEPVDFSPAAGLPDR